MFPDEYVLSCESRPFFWKGEAYMKSQNLSPCEYVTKTKVYPVGRGLGRLLFLLHFHKETNFEISYSLEVWTVCYEVFGDSCLFDQTASKSSDTSLMIKQHILLGQASIQYTNKSVFVFKFSRKDYMQHMHSEKDK